jgi:hypothetical protein
MIRALLAALVFTVGSTGRAQSSSNNATVSPAEEPFQVATAVISFSGNLGTADLVTVPVGKMLVIEHVSAIVDVTGVNGLADVQIAVMKSNPDQIACSQTGARFDGHTHAFACSVSTKYYVGPGQTVSFTVVTYDSYGGAFRAFISGHYVSAATSQSS